MERISLLWITLRKRALAKAGLNVTASSPNGENFITLDHAKKKSVGQGRSERDS